MLHPKNFLALITQKVKSPVNAQQCIDLGFGFCIYIQYCLAASVKASKEVCNIKEKEHVKAALSLALMVFSAANERAPWNFLSSLRACRLYQQQCQNEVMMSINSLPIDIPSTHNQVSRKWPQCSLPRTDPWAPNTDIHSLLVWLLIERGSNALETQVQPN